MAQGTRKPTMKAVPKEQRDAIQAEIARTLGFVSTVPFDAHAVQQSLIYAAPRNDPRVAGYLVPGDNATQLGYEIVLRCYNDIAVCEQPEGSNRGTRIDEIIRRFGLEPPQYWCALWLMGVWADRGAMVPRDGALVENWRKLCRPEWRMTASDMIKASPDAQKHMIGAAILYEGLRNGVKTLVHIGIITRITKQRVFTCEGNRGFAGGITNNGEWVNIEPTQRTDVYGIVIPQRAPQYQPKRQQIDYAYDPTLS